jgi:hypothetical protein
MTVLPQAPGLGDGQDRAPDIDYAGFVRLVANVPSGSLVLPR